jgi:hypothetical protein
MSREILLNVTGAGVWIRGLTALAPLLAREPIDADATWSAPAPAAIPPKERRRAGTFINLAVEVAHQACDNAGVDKSSIPSVFASAMGDTTITDYMCRKLLGTEKLLSPTQFHNSVHNAASGYWTISTGNHAPSSFVGGFDRSLGAGLFEAATLAASSTCPVLLVSYDVTTEHPLRDIRTMDEAGGMALVLAPIECKPTAEPLSRLGLRLNSGVGSSHPAPVFIPSARLKATGQTDALILLDSIARIATAESTAIKLDIPMPRTAHLSVSLSRTNP